MSQPGILSSAAGWPMARVPPSGLGTRRLVLRPLRLADLAALEAIYADPAVTRLLQDGPFPPAEGRQVAAAILRRARSDRRRRGHGTLAVEERASRRVIGTCGIQPLDAAGPPRLELSYVLGRVWWGRGLATEAAGAMAGFAFDGLGATSLWAVIHPDNTASAGVLARLGFRAAGPLACYGALLPSFVLDAAGLEAARRRRAVADAHGAGSKAPPDRL